MGIQACRCSAKRWACDSFNASFGVMGIQAIWLNPLETAVLAFQCLIRRDGYSSGSMAGVRGIALKFQCLIRRDGYSSKPILPTLHRTLKFQCLIRRDGYSSLVENVQDYINLLEFQCLIRRDGYSSLNDQERAIPRLLFQCLIRRDGYSSPPASTRSIPLFQSKRAIFEYMAHIVQFSPSSC